MLPRHDATGLRAGKAAGEGAPSQKTCLAPHIAEPLAEGGFRCFVRPSSRRRVVAALSVLVSGAAGRPRGPPAFPVTITAGNGKVTIPKRPSRIVSLSPTATESLFAIGAGKQVIAVDDQSDYPKSAPKTSLSGFTPNVEAIAAYDPTSSSSRTTRRGSSARSTGSGSRWSSTTPASNFPGAYQQIRQLGLVTGRDAAAPRVDRPDEDADRRDRQDAREAVRPASPSTTSSPPTSTRHRRSRSSARSTRRSASRTSPTRPTPRARAIPQLSAEYIVAASPDLIVLADMVCCGQKASTVAVAAGLGSHQRGPHGLGRADRRLARVALGAAAGELLPRHGDRDRPAEAP